MPGRLLIYPLPEYGHVSPTLPFAARYARAGCEVVYLTDPRFSPEIEAVGARTVPLLPGESFSLGQQVWTRLSPRGDPGERSRFLTDRLRTVAGESHFDLLLLDWLLPKSFGCDVAAAVGRSPRFYFSAALMPWTPRPLPVMDADVLVLCPAELEVAKFRNCGSSVHHVEPVCNDASFQGAAGKPVGEPTLDDRPLVLAAWGSQSSRYGGLPPLLEKIARVAQARPGLQFVVATGNNPGAKRALEAHAAPNLQHFEAVEQRSLLRRAQAMLTHGGMSTLKECILGEVPMLVFPFLADQPMNAMRVARGGLGAALFPEEQAEDRIGKELDAALARHYAPGLQTMAATFRGRLQEQASRRLMDPFLL